MLSTSSTDLSSMMLESFMYQDCLGFTAFQATNLVHILLFETLFMNEPHKMTDRYILM